MTQATGDQLDWQGAGILFKAAQSMADDIRQMYGPQGTDSILEAQFFACVAVSMALGYQVGFEQPELNRQAQGLAEHAVTMLAEQWPPRTRRGVGKLYERRLEEYRELLSDAYLDPENVARWIGLVDALDRHVQNAATGDEGRAAWLMGILVNIGEQLSRYIRPAQRLH